MLSLMMCSALMEMATLAAAIPLVNSLLESQGNIVSRRMGRFSLPEFFEASANPYAWLLGGVIMIVCLGALLRILVIRKMTNFSASVGVELQTLYFHKLLHRDYEVAINQSSSKKISILTQKINILIATYILGILNSLTAVVSSIAVLFILFYLGTPVVFMALLVLIVGYLLIALLCRTKLKRYGNDIRTQLPQKIRCVQESLGGFRDVSMAGSQEVFVRRLTQISSKTEVANARLIFYSAFPRPFLEAIGISTIALIAWGSYSGIFELDNLIPMLGVFTLGMLRLLPFAQSIFGQWTKVLNAQLILSDYLHEMDYFTTSGSNIIQEPQSIDLPFTRDIDFSGVSFTYQSAKTAVIKDVNLSINKGDFIGIVGPTGSGKSTIVDVLMGLLPPSEGIVSIDGVELNRMNRAAWRRRVAHVPQKIYLTEGSIAQNIAFGIPDDQIDWNRLRLCGTKAYINEFVDSLEDGYQSRVGEDGTRLSGGQRQRIGIARALYSRCDVLVFDEATNALDAETEKAVVQGILQLEHEYTIIIIAHNPQVVEYCQRCFVVENGHIAEK